MSSKSVFCSVYQIVLETLSGTQAGMAKRSPAESTPCGLPPSKLGSYSQARSVGQGCYITAEISKVEKETEFVVGDNKTYGGYYNAPLQKGQSYDVWVGLVVTVDGVSIVVFLPVLKYSASAFYDVTKYIEAFKC